MTVILDKPERTGWSARPGWNIVSDLTPPELIEARKLKVLQKWIGVALVGVLLLCAAGVALAFLKHRSQTAALDAAKGRADELTAQQTQYRSVTGLQSLTARVDGSLQTVAGRRVPVADMVTKIRAALPASMAITALTVTVTGGPAAAPAAAPADPTGATGAAATPTTAATPTAPTSGAAISTVTLNGTAAHLVDLAGYVTALGKLAGVVNVVPANNSTGPAGTATWSITLQLTAAVSVPTTRTK